MTCDRPLFELCVSLCNYNSMCNSSTITIHIMFNLRTYVLVYIWVGCLQSFVTDKDKNGPLLFDKVVDFSYQLFSALDFLHSSLRILHRDIKRTYDNACIKKIVYIVISTMHAHVHTQCIHTYTCTHIHTHVHVLACTRTCMHTQRHINQSHRWLT